jgi:subtilisin family serine protease
MSEPISGGVCREPLDTRTLLAGEPWGAFPRLIDLDLAASRYPTITGQGQTIAVIDTGIDYRHPALGGGFGAGRKVIAGYDFVDDDGDPFDNDGHGTGVAGVIGAEEFVYGNERYRGIAPDASLIALRAGHDRSIERAFQWVLANRTQYNIVAVNISLGSGSATQAVSLDPFGDEITALYNAGVFVSAVSGNGGVRSDGSISYPGIHPHAYAVGSVNDADVISTFTRRSSHVDLLAPGEEVPVPYYDASRGRHVYLTANGTSFAAPHAAGMAALLKQIDPSITPAEIMQVLQQSGEANFDGDRESSPTTGLTFRRLNVAGAIAMTLQRVDDAYEDNDSTSSATGMSLGDGYADFDDLRLRNGDDDYFVFDLGRRSDVTLRVSTSGGSAVVDLLNGAGSRIGGAGSGTTTFRLAAGRYYLRFDGDGTSTVSYSFDIGTSVVGPPAVGARYSSVATDAGGTAHVAYYDAKRQNLWYVTRSANGDWSDATAIDSGNGVGQFVSLALDHKSRPAVAYYDSRNGDLKYALLHGMDWQVQKVETKGDVGQYASLAFNGRRHAVIAYYSNDRKELHFAELTAKGWALRTIDTDGNAGRYASVAIHPDTGLPAIAYVNSADDSVRLAEMVTSKKWRVSAPVHSKRGATHTSFAFDSVRRPIISYYDAAGKELRFARRSAAGRWDVSTIDSNGSVGKFSRIIPGSASTAQVFYYNATEASVYRATLGASGWSTSRIATGGGTYLSAANLFGQKLILFRDAESGVLREAVV